MRILILSRYQDSVNRGVETVVSELSKGLSKNNQVTVLSGRTSDSFWQMVSQKYDIVMPMNGRTQSLKASLGRIIGTYKLVIGGHSGIGRDDIFNIVVCRPDVFIGLTDYMADWARKWAWGGKVVKIHDGVNTTLFTPSGKKIAFGLKSPLVLSIGTLEWYKYHERTIEAVTLLKGYSLLIVGKGKEKNKLEALGRMKLGNRFKIISSTHQDLPAVYRAADVFTLPSWDREAFGVVYLEAMACGLPVVAPDDPPRREIVGDAGIFVDTNSAQKLANAIEEAVSKKWGRIPRLQAEKFSWDKIVKEYENCFLSLLR